MTNPIVIPEATPEEALAWCFEMDPEAAAEGLAEALRLRRKAN